MNPTDIDIADIVALAHRAGDAILEVYQSDFKSKFEATGSR